MSKKDISRITIPTIGSDLILATPWAFMLYHETRNEKFLETLGIEYDYSWRQQKMAASEVALPAGTRLKVDRIYIKKGNGDYDSVTFTMKKGNYPGDKKKSGRFWAKLNDVNRIECTWDEETVKRFTDVSPLTQLAAEAPSTQDKGDK